MAVPPQVLTMSACTAADAAADSNGFEGRGASVQDSVRQQKARHRKAAQEAKARRDRFRRLFDSADRPLPPYAKFDDSGVVVKGLFTSLDPNAPESSGRIEFKKLLCGEEFELTISCGTPLGDSDQRVFRGLVAHATDAYAALAGDRRYGRAPVQDPDVKVRVRCTLKRLAEVAGFRSPGAGPTNDVIRQSLGRLCDVKLSWRKVGVDGCIKEEMLIVNEGSLKGHGAVNASFHSTLQEAILASRPDEHYLCVNMNDARRLESRSARLLHHRLTHVNAGGSVSHGLQTLEGYLWRAEAPSADAASNREDQLFKAMAEMEGIGWRFEPDEHPGCVKVTRPATDSPKSVEVPEAGAAMGRNSKE